MNRNRKNQKQQPVTSCKKKEAKTARCATRLPRTTNHLLRGLLRENNIKLKWLHCVDLNSTLARAMKHSKRSIFIGNGHTRRRTAHAQHNFA